MKNYLPTGMPFYYRMNNKGLLDFEFAGNPHGWSKECLDWLSYMAWDPRFKKSDQEQYLMQSAVTGEYELEYEGQTYRVDGAVQTPNKIYFLEFFGCFFHRCPYCQVKSSVDTTKSDQNKLEILQKFGKVIMIRGCQWKKIKTKWSGKSPYSNFFNQKNIAMEAILSSVKSNDWFGLLEVDIDTPESAREKFREINFGTIFDKISVSENMVPESMLDALSHFGRKFPLSPQLTLVFEAKEYLLTSETLKLYLELGLQVTKIHSCIEYQRSKPLDDFINTSLIF